MAKKSKALREFIADNFDIKKYDACSELDIISWYNALLFRFLVYGTHVERGDRSPEATEVISRILAAPLSGPNKGAPFMGEAKHTSVEDLRIADFIGQMEMITQMPGMPEIISKYKKCLSENVIGKEPKEIFSSFHSQCLNHGICSGMSNLVPTIVDLHATDDQLTLEFQEWLRRKRAEMEFTGSSTSYADEKITLKSMRDWSATKVLAYIDLSNTALYFSSEIPYHVIGDLLYPDEIEIDAGERVRKKTRPLAQKLQDENFLAALGSAATKAHQAKPEQKSS